MVTETSEEQAVCCWGSSYRQWEDSDHPALPGPTCCLWSRETGFFVTSGGDELNASSLLKIFPEV